MAWQLTKVGFVRDCLNEGMKLLIRIGRRIII